MQQPVAQIRGLPRVPCRHVRFKPSCPECSQLRASLGDGGNATQRAERSATILNKTVAVAPILDFECRNWDRRGGAWIVMSSAIENGHGTLLSRHHGKICECVEESTQLAGLLDPMSRSACAIDIGL